MVLQATGTYQLEIPGKEGEEDEEEEEQLVMVELSGIIDLEFLTRWGNKCKILGIDTERPILQVDSYVFAGEYEGTLGTCVVFEENTDQVDAYVNYKTELKYKCHTMKKLSMMRILLTEKEGEENIGGVEWLQIKDNDFSYRPIMICSCAHQKEDEEVAAQAPDKTLEVEEQEIQAKENTGMGSELEKADHLEMEYAGPLLDSPSSETEDSTSMETQEPALEATPR
ncbi:general transcription factor 3C polypeptide 6-like [Dromiciops gliroides]|uniref:general transcription factor 3C polypeptide 6-like n=1 Tax=Dromiciops gliroides TaxID=33562 RepID=UPI001CC519BA|nr:general transcription factor 3C polypeptide 6-like [Dromiciops gliroides]